MNLNSIVNIIREDRAYSAGQLYDEIKKLEIGSPFIEEYDPLNFDIELDSKIKIKEFFGNKEIDFNAMDEDITDLESNTLYLDLFDGEEDGEENGQEVDIPVFNLDVEYIPKDNDGNYITFIESQKNDTDFMKTNIFPQKSDGRPNFTIPINLDPNHDEDKFQIISQIYELFIGAFIDKLLISTNEYLSYVKAESSRKKIPAPWFTTYVEFTKQDIKNYFAIFIYAGLFRVANVEEYWKKPDDVFKLLL